MDWLPLGWTDWISLQSKGLSRVFSNTTVQKHQFFGSQLSSQVHIVKTMVFPVVKCAYESWALKKAEHRRIDGFELWCWRRLLRVPWTARRSSQSILKEINLLYIARTDAEAEATILWPSDANSWLIGKTLMLGKMKAKEEAGKGYDG